MGYQQEIEFHTVCFPVTSSLAVVLFFDDKLFQRKSLRPEKNVYISFCKINN